MEDSQDVNRLIERKLEEQILFELEQVSMILGLYFDLFFFLYLYLFFIIIIFLGLNKIKLENLSETLRERNVVQSELNQSIRPFRHGFLLSL